MSSILGVQAREASTKGSLHKQREAGNIPGVIYGGGKSSQGITFIGKELEHILEHSGKGINTLIEIQMNGDKGTKTDTVMIHDIQRDPVSRKLIHADYYRISMTEKITAEVHLIWVGEPQGVKEGGRLQPILRSIQIECLPDKIPNDFEIGVADLMIGDSITVADLSLSPDFKILNDPHSTVVQVVATREEEVAATIKPEAAAPDNDKATDPS